VNPVDPNLALLELIAAALGPLRERFVFVGGCTTGMLLTDIAAAPVRATRDVDDEIGALLENREFIQAVPGHLAGDETSQARLPLIKDRLRQLSLAA
jgi:hypothetical protein